jgi:hypothetical protein
VGRTEEIVGPWRAARKDRDTLLATKITGAGQAALRNGAPLTAETIERACEASLRRLRANGSTSTNSIGPTGAPTISARFGATTRAARIAAKRFAMSTPRSARRSG